MSETWVGSNSGTSLWDKSANWSLGSVPSVSSQTVAIAEAGTYTVQILTSDPMYTVRSLSLGGSGSSPTLSVSGQLNVQKQVSLATGSAIDIGISGSLSTSRLTLASGSSIVDLGSLNVSGTLSGRGSVLVDGAELFTNNIAGINTYTLVNGATMTISNSVSSSGAIVFGDGSGDTLNLDSAGSSFGAEITGFGGGDTIDIGSLTYSSSYTLTYSNATLTISNGSSTLFTFTDINNPGAVALQDDGAGGTEIVTCFLHGTGILTQAGEVPVETLARGDLVATLAGGSIRYQPVKWVGVRHVGSGLAAQGRIRPVRILAGAFGPKVPSRDLLVTPEHCLYLGGGLVPARMLVNGRSILEERPTAAFSFYHVELDRHALLLAHGLATESYLDTGNRAGFANATGADVEPGAWHGVERTRSWRVDACAPLLTDRGTVEPLWRELSERADSLGLGDRRCGQHFADDPQLHLLLDNGDRVFARWNSGGQHFFHIPSGRKPVRLRSLACSPAQSIGPFIDDRRALGVQVRAVVFWDGLRDQRRDARDLALPGWHEAEGDVRWTDGDATLDGPRATTTASFLSVEVVASLLYPHTGADQAGADQAGADTRLAA